LRGNIIKKIAPLLLTLVLFSGVKSYAADNISYFYDGDWHVYTEAPVYFKVNGDAVISDMPPILFNDSTLVPARAVFEKMGAKITWDEPNSKVIVNFENKSIEININSVNAMVNGQGKIMPIPAKLINDRTMIPVRFVSETLGNRVLWDDSKREVDVETPINIKSISSSVINNKLRITVDSDRAMFEVNNFILENNDRIVLDLQHAVFLPSAQNVSIPKNSIVTAVRAAQSTVNPYLTRIVADLSSKVNYSVTMSEDKKQVFLDIDIGGTSVGVPQVNYGIDSMEINLPVDRSSQYYLYSMGEKGIFYLDLPKSKFNSLPNIIQPASSSLINKIEFIQENDTSRLKVYSDKPVLAKVINQNGAISLRLMAPATGKVEYTNTNGLPRISFKSELTSINYFRYAYRDDGNTFVLRTYSQLGCIPDSKLFINDGVINTIVFEPYGSYGMEYFIEPANKLAFRVNSVSKPNTLYVEPYTPRTALGTEVPITEAMKKKIVVVDPGHGGSDPGAVVKNSVGVDVYEKNLNLAISLKLYDMLKNAGFTAQLTRSDDSFVDLYERARMANDLDAALFVSIHNNIVPGGGSGTMNLFYPSLPQAKYGVSSERVAQIAEEETVGKLGSVDLGIYKRPRLAVLNGTNMPAILSEIGVMNDPTEFSKLQDPAYREKAASALFNVIKRSLYEMEFKDAANAMTPDPAVSRGGVDDSKPIVANGFTLPALATAKAAYNWKDTNNSYYFDLSIMLDYSKEVTKTATLEEQRKEAIAVLNSNLDATTVNTITEAINRQSDFSSHIYEEEIETSQYIIWVRSIKTTGVCSIDIRKK